MSSMRAAAMTVVLGLSAAACTRKPSAEECGRAWQHVSEILEEMAIEDLNRMAADAPDNVRKRMAEDLKAGRATLVSGQGRDALIPGCRRAPPAPGPGDLDAHQAAERV